MNRLYRCWWQLLETVYIGDKFEMVEPIFYIEKSHQHNDFVATITLDVGNEMKLTDISDSLYLSMPNQNEVAAQYCVC